MSKHNLSTHLRREEVQTIESLLGKARCKSMAIAELAISANQDIVTNDDSQTFVWKSVVQPGLVCFVQDPTKNNDYFIQAFNLDKPQKEWSQQVDPKMKYRRRRRHIVTFDGVYGLACLNFVDDDESDSFISSMTKVLGISMDETQGMTRNSLAVDSKNENTKQ